MTLSLHRTDRESAPTVDALVSRARAGDRDAFDRLHERYAALVHGVLLASAPPSDVDDLMQDVFLAAWRALPAGQEVRHIGAWLATIARNRARRRHAREHATSALPDDVAAAATPASPAEGGEILDAVRGLPSTYAETLALRLVEGMTGPEIAEWTGMTHGSVRVNLSRGMKMLREALERRGYS